jgi:phosphoribosylformylglycinamidine (FGAM) synthase PurS component
VTIIDATIELVIPDNTAFTVRSALRHLGYENLTKVERSEHLMLTVTDSASPQGLVSQLSRAEVLFNPNKHRLRYAVVGTYNDVDRASSTASGRPEGGQLHSDSEPAEFEALVYDKDDNTDRLLRSLTGVFGMSGLLGIERAVGWRLFDENGSASRERLEWACNALLCNSVSQRYDIRPRPLRHAIGELHGAASKGEA